MTIKEASKILGVTIRSVQEYISKGYIVVEKRSNKLILNNRSVYDFYNSDIFDKSYNCLIRKREGKKINYKSMLRTKLKNNNIYNDCVKDVTNNVKKDLF